MTHEPVRVVTVILSVGGSIFSERCSMGGTYRDLTAWQKAMDLAAGIYHCTRHFPDHERFGLASQLRRAAVSIPSNVAEGKGRASDRDLAHFLVCARGSTCEIQTQ